MLGHTCDGFFLGWIIIESDLSFCKDETLENYNWGTAINILARDWLRLFLSYCQSVFQRQSTGLSCQSVSQSWVGLMYCVTDFSAMVLLFGRLSPLTFRFLNFTCRSFRWTMATSSAAAQNCKPQSCCLLVVIFAEILWRMIIRSHVLFTDESWNVTKGRDILKVFLFWRC